MPKQKPKRKGRYSKYNWIQIEQDWLRFRGTLTDFAKLKKISYPCMRAHIKVGEKKTTKLEVDVSAEDFLKVVEQATIGENTKVYLKALNRSYILLERMTKDLSLHWVNEMTMNRPFASANEVGRLALATTEKMRESALELQGIPREMDGFGWPLTKNFWPQDYQRNFIFDMPGTCQVAGKPLFIQAFVGGIRSGKTYCGAQKAGEIAFRNRGCWGSIFAPTYRMLEDSTKRTFIDVINSKGISYKYRATDNSIMLFGDTKIIFRSMDDEEHLRGEELAWAWIDEGGQMPNGSAFDIINGRVNDPLAKMPLLLFTSTPKGLGWAYDKLVDDAEKNRALVYQAKTRQNIYLSDDYKDRLEDMYDERYAKQELGGEWIDVFAGQAYWAFSRADNVTNSYNYDAYLPLILAFDLNVDPMCWNVIQTFHGDSYDIDVVIDEIHIRSANTDETIKEFKRRYGNHKAGVRVYGDSTSRARKTSATYTDYEIIKKGLSENMPALEMHVGRSNPAVTDSIAAVNARFKSMTGKHRLFVHPRCKYTIKDFERVAFKSGSREIDKKTHMLTHHSDAIRYFIAREYPIRKIKVSVK